MKVSRTVRSGGKDGKQRRLCSSLTYRYFCLLHPEELLKVNHEVNAQEVEPNDFLGEHIYEVTDFGFEIVA